MPARRSPSRRLCSLQLHLSGAAVESTFEKKQAYVQPSPGAAFYHEYPSSSTMYSAEDTEAAVPHPAMTPGERLHLEINGYVVIKDVFSKEECAAMIEQIFAIEQALHASADPTTWTPHPATHLQGRTHEFFRVDNLPHLCKEFFDFCTHPRIRGFAAEACGGRVRIGQSDAHIHRGKRERPPEAAERIAREGGFGFHGGYGGNFAPQIHTVDSNGLTHCAFMKCLTNLTDLDSPEDGGTTVIAGSHKIHNTVDRAAMVAAALEDPTLIHHVVAPAGSTLVFFESLLHSGGSGLTYNGKERILILGTRISTVELCRT